MKSQELDQIVDAVTASAKYRPIASDFVRSIASIEVAKRRTSKEAVKATKNKLHQVAGAFFEHAVDPAWLELLQGATASDDQAAVRLACREIMAHHTSTKERLPILDQFYTKTLADIGPVGSVIDLACGLNPLAIPWMPLAPHATYHAYDIFDPLMAFLSDALPLLSVEARAEAQDIVQHSPTERADLALVLKAIPCLEQIDKSVGARLLDALDVAHMLVSFPSQSLGGRSKGMAATYEQHLYDLIGERPWQVRHYSFPREIAFLISKAASG